MPWARSTPRPGSPPTRSSTLITSAPRSPSITEQTGPCCQIVQSITRIPSSGIDMAPQLAGDGGGGKTGAHVWVVPASVVGAPAMLVLLTGGTGFIGGSVARALRTAGHDVTIVSRHPGHVPAKAIAWDGVGAAMAETDAVVNLAGESVASGRWTATR